MAKLTDYFDGTAHEPLIAEIREHMCACRHCEVIVDSVEKTIHIYRDHELYEYELPENLRDRLRTAIMERCKDKKGSC